MLFRSSAFENKARTLFINVAYIFVLSLSFCMHAYRVRRAFYIALGHPAQINEFLLHVCVCVCDTDVNVYVHACI